MKKSIIILMLGMFVLSLLAVSCCPCRNLSNTVVSDHKDSSFTKTEIKWKDSVYHTPVDSAAIRATVKCPDNGVINLPEVTKTSKQSTITVGIKNNQLTAKCKCDALELLLKEKETTIEKYRLQAEKKSEVKIIQEKYIPKWMKIVTAIGAAITLFTIIKIAIKLYLKFYIKWQNQTQR